MEAGELGGTRSGHRSVAMEMPCRCQDTCSNADATTTMLFENQSGSTPGKDASSPHQTRSWVTRGSEMVAIGGKHCVQLAPTPVFPRLGAKDREATDEIHSLYQPYFKEECATVIHCIRQYPLWASVRGACGTLDLSKIETEPSPLCDWTMESSHLQAENESSKLGPTMQKVQGMGYRNSSVVKEETEEWNQESSGSSVSISKRTFVSYRSKDTACIKSSINSSPKCKLNHLNTQGSKQETETVVFVDCLEEVSSERGQQKGSSSLTDGTLHPNALESGSSLTTDVSELSSSKRTYTISESSIVTNSMSDSGKLEVESKNECAGSNFTVSITELRPALEPTLNHLLDNTSEFKVTLEGENLANPELSVGFIKPCASKTGMETVPGILESKAKVNELEGDTAVEPVTSFNLIATISWSDPALEHGTDPVLEKVESKDNLSEHSVGVTHQSGDTVNEKAVPLSDATYNFSMEAENAGGVSMCSLDSTLDKAPCLVTSTPLIMPKSFKFANVAPPTASHIKKKSDVGSVVSERSVDISNAAGPSTDICVNLPPPSRLKCPPKALPKPTTWTRRHGRDANSSNIVSNRKSLLLTSGPPTNHKSMLPPLRSSATPLSLCVGVPSLFGGSSLGRKMDLNSRHMASTSSLEGKKQNALAGTKILSSALSKPHLSSIPTLGAPRSRLGLVRSTALKEPPTSSQKQPRGNPDDALPISKRKKIDNLGAAPSSVAVKDPAASTSTFKRATTQRTSMQLKSRNTGASRMSGTLISRSSARVDSTALAKPSERTPQLSKVETRAQNTECESCVRYRKEIDRLRAELQKRGTVDMSDRKGEESGFSSSKESL